MLTIRVNACSLALLVLLGSGGEDARLQAQQWTEFRGPGGSGIASAANLPSRWSEDQNVAWKTVVPGRGWSSPVVADDQVWLTSAVETELSPAQREEKMKSARIPGLMPVQSIELFALCFDARTGELQAKLKLGESSDPPLIHSLNSFSSPTPVLDDDSVYCSFGTFGTWCIDRKTRQVKWSNRELELDHETGPGSSPILWQDLLIFHCDGIDYQFVVALDRESGKVVWKTDRSGELNETDSLRKAFSTPIVVSIDGADQLVSAGANWLYGYQPDTGAELWKMPYGKLGFSNVPRPVYHDGMLYLCTGYSRSSLFAIRFDDPGGPGEEDLVWRYETQVPTMPTPLLTDGLLLMVSDRGIATCLDAKTGEKHWQERLGGGFASSPILADGKVYVGNRKGEMFVIRPGDEFDLLATNQMDGDIMATPAAVGEQLLVRTKESLYRIQKQ
ncbi:MAG: PQQ-binding-like beta-propeller repeat protein [Mariniblastus sp.]|nr:PQQ-binding-like beta-propeller repeat protein [Mariniblastus sp.]